MGKLVIGRVDDLSYLQMWAAQALLAAVQPAGRGVGSSSCQQTALPQAWVNSPEGLASTPRGGDLLSKRRRSGLPGSCLSSTPSCFKPLQ